jgi:negative regulator of flagellin synthesis FlgM
MAIDINSLTKSGSAQTQVASESSKVQVGRNEPTKAQSETGKSSTADTVSLTDTAARLQSLENSLASLPVADPQRIESVRKAINEGTLNINPEEVAEKMIDFEAALNKAS